MVGLVYRFVPGLVTVPAASAILSFVRQQPTGMHSHAERRNERNYGALRQEPNAPYFEFKFLYIH